MISENLDVVLVVIGALIGSVKTSIELDKNKAICSKLINIAIGVFCGCVVPLHYGTTYSTGLLCLVALLSGVGGSMVVEVFMQLLPSLTKKYLKKLAEKLP